MDQMFHGIDRVHSDIDFIDVIGNREATVPPGFGATVGRTDSNPVMNTFDNRVAELSNQVTSLQVKIAEKDQIISMLLSQLTLSQSSSSFVVSGSGQINESNLALTVSQNIANVIDKKLETLSEEIKEVGTSVANVQHMQTNIVDKLENVETEVSSRNQALVGRSPEPTIITNPALPSLFMLPTAFALMDAEGEPVYSQTLDKLIRKHIMACKHVYPVIAKQSSDNSCTRPNYIGTEGPDPIFPRTVEVLLMMNNEQIKRFVAWYPVFQKDMRVSPSISFDNSQRLGVARWKVFYWIEQKCGRFTSSQLR
jgi:prefoldin subunit 5